MMREVTIECEDDSPLLDGPWLVQPMPDSVHVVFEYELARHELDRGCWCSPRVEVRHPDTLVPYTKPIVVHRHHLLGVGIEA